MNLRRRGLMLVAVAFVLAGCAARRERSRRQAAPPARQPAKLTLYSPCIISGAMLKVATAYEARHPEVEIIPQTYKPLEALPHKGGPGVVVTVGDKEMGALVRAGAIAVADVHTFAVNPYPLAIVAPAQGRPSLKRLSDVASPAVRRIFLEDPKCSTLGARAREGLQRLGLWDEVRAKTICPRPGVMVLAELLAGKADAAVVFKSCLFGGEAGEGGAPPRTVRVVGELPMNLFSPIPFQAAALKTSRDQESARGFVAFLRAGEGLRVLRRAGLRPAGAP